MPEMFETARPVWYGLIILLAPALAFCFNAFTFRWEFTRKNGHVVPLLGIGISLFLSLSLMPVLASLALPRRIRERDPWLVRLAHRAYAPVIELALRFRKATMAGAIVLAGYLGFNPPDFAAGTVALAFGLAASSIFPALMMGIFSKRINREGAIAGMIAGISVTLLYVFQHKGIMFVAETSYLGDMSPNWFFGIEPNAFGAVGAVVNFVVATAVSKVTAPPPEDIQHLVEDIRVPAGAGGATGH